MSKVNRKRDSSQPDPSEEPVEPKRYLKEARTMIDLALYEAGLHAGLSSNAGRRIGVTHWRTTPREKFLQARNAHLERMIERGENIRLG